MKIISDIEQTTVAGGYFIPLVDFAPLGEFIFFSEIAAMNIAMASSALVSGGLSYAATQNPIVGVMTASCSYGLTYFGLSQLF